MMTRLLPTPEESAKLLSDLLGRKVSAKKIAQPGVKALPNVGVFTFDDGSLAYVCGCDIAGAGNLGAALSMIPKGAVADALEEGEISGALRDNFGEVLNLCTRLFHDRGAAHLRLTGVHTAGEPIPAEFLALLAAPDSRLDLEIDIDGYGAGKMSFVGAR